MRDVNTIEACTWLKSPLRRKAVTDVNIAAAMTQTIRCTEDCQTVYKNLFQRANMHIVIDDDELVKNRYNEQVLAKSADSNICHIKRQCCAKIEGHYLT